MLNRFFGTNTHNHLHVLGLCGIAMGIPFNKVVMSVSMMFIVLNLLLEADFKTYWKNIRSNRIYTLVFLFIGLHVLAILWTSNLDNAFHDLRVKLPLLVIPTVLISKPIVKRKYLHIILGTFIASTLLISLINFLFYQQWIGNIDYNDIRGMSLFSSHVRFALIVAMAAAIVLYYLKYNRALLLFAIGLLFWFAFYTFFSQVISGIIALAAVFILFMTSLLWQKRKILAISMLSLICLGLTLLIYWILSPIQINPDEYKNLPKYTSEGNEYAHSFSHVSPETGKPLYIYICYKELTRDWSEYSEMTFKGKDKKGQPMEETVIRYLASKDLTKDAKGLSKLSEKDILNIEKGNASVVTYGILARLYGLKFELNNEKDPNGHSLLERIEFWKGGMRILSGNYIIGVGTGDVQDSFNAYYTQTSSQLLEENRNRSHNMYLTIFLTFGIAGIVLFIWLHISFISFNVKNNETLAILFIVIVLSSFLIEDTLETQTGITFYSLFLGLFSNKIKPALQKRVKQNNSR